MKKTLLTLVLLAATAAMTTGCGNTHYTNHTTTYTPDGVNQLGQSERAIYINELATTYGGTLTVSRKPFSVAFDDNGTVMLGDSTITCSTLVPAALTSYETVMRCKEYDIVSVTIRHRESSVPTLDYLRPE
jgi:hypothetical protein